MFGEEDSRCHLRIKPRARQAVQHCLKCSSTPIGYYRPSIGLGFHRHDSKIFFSGEKQRAAARVVLPHHLIGNVTEERHGGARQAAQPPVFLSVANDL